MKEKRDYLKIFAYVLVIIIGVLSIYTICVPKAYIPSIIAAILIVIAVILALYDSHRTGIKPNSDKVFLSIFLILWFLAEIFRLPHMGYGILACKAIAGITVIIMGIWIIVKEIKKKKA